MTKVVKVMEEDWDHLIILDACRYDFFSKMYNKYLEGKLIKAKSVGSCTVEWLIKSFPDYYNDVVYFSANPYVTSRGEIKLFFGLIRWKASDHFHKIIDIWNIGWDDFLGTVPPWKVNEIVLKLKDKYPNKRFIIHYLQPHEPYLYYLSRSGKFGKPNPMKGEFLRYYKQSKKFLERLVKYLNHYILAKTMHILGLRAGIAWHIREKFNLPPFSPMDFVRRNYGVHGLRKAYAFNLRIALEFTAILINYLSGKIVITSDHGEFLGEKGQYSHWWGINDNILTCVPWFIVKKSKISSLSMVAKRIKSLCNKYFLKKRIEHVKRTLRQKIRKHPDVKHR